MEFGHLDPNYGWQGLRTCENRGMRERWGMSRGADVRGKSLSVSLQAAVSPSALYIMNTLYLTGVIAAVCQRNIINLSQFDSSQCHNWKYSGFYCFYFILFSTTQKTHCACNNSHGTEWMDEWMDRLMDGWVDRQMNGWEEGWMNGWIQWIKWWMDGWMDGWMDRYMD